MSIHRWCWIGLCHRWYQNGLQSIIWMDKSVRIQIYMVHFGFVSHWWASMNTIRNEHDENANFSQIFSIAISGNLANYLQEASRHYVWRYNFHLVSIASTTIITYVCLMPIVLWASFKWLEKQSSVTTLEEVRAILTIHANICYLIFAWSF